MLKTAVTGGIACGKSLAGLYFSESGAAVCDADDLAHKVMARGTTVFEKILERFDGSILGSNGEIDRRKLGEKVFCDSGELAALNAIVHPEVKNAWLTWLAERSFDCRVAVVIVPLLYEAGEGCGWDAVVSVSLKQELQFRRLTERGFSEKDAKSRIEAQFSQVEKARLADYVIMNDGTKDLLKEQVKRVLKHIMEKETWQQ